MPCPAIITGDRFLTRALTHLDCQADVIGSYGYQALSQPGSLASTVMAGLLTLFIAFLGIRLLFGPPPGMRDLVYDTLKVGIVLTLAFSWPAFRTVILDVVTEGPAEIAHAIGASSSGSANSGLLSRLQAADDAMLDLTRAGTGRNVGAYVDERAPGGTFASTALGDESGYAWSRLFWLAGTIGIYGLLRLLAGLLLALAPLSAGLLLFKQTRGLFSGWLRGLVLALVGTVGATLVLTVEMSALEPWLADALRIRQLGYATPAAPTELLALTLGFTIVQLGLLAILARVAFTRGWQSRVTGISAVPPQVEMTAGSARVAVTGVPAMSRAESLADTIEIQLRREGVTGGSWADRRIAGSLAPGFTLAGAGNSDTHVPIERRLGSSYRRTTSRGSRSMTARTAR